MNQPAPTPIPFTNPDGDACLLVLNGLHQHARLKLAQQPWYLVGAAEDCDVVLRDAGIHPHHLLVSLDSGGGVSGGGQVNHSADHDSADHNSAPGPRWRLRALDAALRVDGHELPAGESISVVGTVVCQLGPVRFGLGQPTSAAWQTMLDAQRTATGASTAGFEAHAHNASFERLGPQPEDLGGAQQGPAPEHDVPAAAWPDGSTGSTGSVGSTKLNQRHHPNGLSPQRTTLRRVLWGGGIGLLMGMTSAFAWVIHSQVQQERESRGGVERIVADLELKELQIARGQNGHVRLVGTVATEALRSRLQSSLKEAGLEPTLDVVTGERLAAGVQDSFRQQGLPVQARYVGAGRVLVAGAAASPASEQVIRDILAKTPSLSHIELSAGSVMDAAATPHAGPPPGSPPAAVAAPGTGAQADANAANASIGAKAGARGDPKRVVAVVGGDDPYLLTQDGARYLVGAVLPDGSLVESVDGHTVNFLRNGRQVKVEF
jgi:type III secretion system YscD/HrpQ family protein